MKRLVLLLATGFGLGYAPIASGTFGTLPGILIAALLHGTGVPLGWQVAACGLMSLLAVPVCDAAEAHFGRKDDGRIVADEYLTFPICVLGLPLVQHPWLLLPAFLSARAMDIVKIPPARQSQSLRGGLGIVTDDVIASLYALALNHAGWYTACRLFGWGPHA